MDETATVWMIALLGFAAGIGFGALIYHVTRPNSGSKAQKLAARIDEVERVHQKYEEDVAKHFVQTADLVNQLTESYRDVHAHLAEGAQSLCGNNEDLRLRLESSLANRLMSTAESPQIDTAPSEEPAPDTAANPVEPPKDYAPKSDPAEKGTLSEDFSVERGSKN